MPEELIDPSTLIGRPETDPLVQRFIHRCKLVDWNGVEEFKQWNAQREAEVCADMTEEEKRRYLEVSKETAQYGDKHLTHSNAGLTQLVLKFTEPGAPRVVDNIIMRPGSLGQLPFGLQPDVDLSGFTIGRLIDKGKMTDEGVVSHSREFLHGNLSIHLCFDEPFRYFSFLRIAAVAPGELAKLRFHDGLAAQKTHLVANIDHHLEPWQKSSPVHQWRRRMREGDSIFNESNLKLTEEELGAFFLNIQQAVKKRSPKQIINALKKTIKNLNRLNSKHGHFIETMEREDLVPFLQDVLRATGLRFEEGFDVTLEWREW